VAKAGRNTAIASDKFIPWWNQTIAVVPTSSDDAHRPLGKEHSLAASLSYVETRQVSNDYTIQVDNQIWQIARSDIRAGLRGGVVRVEVRLDDSLAVRFGKLYLAVTECQPRPKVPSPRARPKRKPAAPGTQRQWMKNFRLTSPEKTDNQSCSAVRGMTRSYLPGSFFNSRFRTRPVFSPAGGG
jgi:hypothetical protein